MKIKFLQDSTLIRAFRAVFSIDGQQIVEKIEDADLIISVGIDQSTRLAYATSDAFFGILEVRPLPNGQPDNVFVMDGASLIHGNRNVATMLERFKVWSSIPRQKKVLEEVPADRIVKFDRVYKVLIIDDKKENLARAMYLLPGQQILPVDSFEMAMNMMKDGGFDAVLTDLHMPPDKGYTAVSLDSYPLGADEPVGMSVVFEATRLGMPVAVVTDANHHLSWFTAMFGGMDGATVNRQKVIFRNDSSKRWDVALADLMAK
jgi:CheY-like chemotaxis protein